MIIVASHVLISRKKSGKILIEKRVRQADTISLVILIECLEEVFKLLDWGGSRAMINGEYVNNLQLADDIVLSSNAGDSLQQLIADLNRESVRVG